MAYESRYAALRLFFIVYPFGNIVHCSVFMKAVYATVTQYYHDIELLMIYWETYLVKPFATLNTMISAVSLRTVQRPCVLDCRKCPRELRKLLGKYHYV
ncbi:hypothetical protein T12_148 [Trichinella patagoniensis]|uniref:Uncharacterized protein n=1 Tax=Trichinella patagoniensis TaxID=990121 RepID=A0A0V0ZNK6_9BILA|nr:hypothetical protein T12_148 [Trichinella patagoniensis]